MRFVTCDATMALPRGRGTKRKAPHGAAVRDALLELTYGFCGRDTGHKALCPVSYLIFDVQTTRPRREYAAELTLRPQAQHPLGNICMLKDLGLAQCRRFFFEMGGDRPVGS